MKKSKAILKLKKLLKNHKKKDKVTRFEVVLNGEQKDALKEATYNICIANAEATADEILKMMDYYFQQFEEEGFL